MSFKPPARPCMSSPPLSLLFSQDFFIMFIHHLATISLISFSYVNNMVRVGSLVMCVHDASDFLLEVSGTTTTTVITHSMILLQSLLMFPPLEPVPL